MTQEKPKTFVTRSCGHTIPRGENKCVYCAPPRLSIQPLADLLRARIERSSVVSVSLEVAQRLGQNPETVKRYVQRVLSGEFKRVGLYVADEYAVALGEMAATMWGNEWDEANPVEPYGDENEDFD